MAEPIGWQGDAFNQVPESDNRIHSDEVARAYGFRGGLVPGVTVSAYLLHPAVVAWGVDFLARGRARVVVKKPLYDRGRFDVGLSRVEGAAYSASLTDAEAVTCAVAEVTLPDATPVAPGRRHDPAVPHEDERPEATEAVLEALAVKGMGAIEVTWDDSREISRYLRDAAAMPELLRFDGGAYANPAFMLALTNWHLAANVRLGPWVHLQTESQFHAPVEVGTKLVVEGRIKELFRKKGHGFVDVDVEAYRADGAPVMSAEFRCIYALRPAASE